MHVRNLREFSILTFSAFLIFLMLTSNARAQVSPVEVTIHDLQYPSQISLQSGGATVSFSVDYKYLSGKLDYVVAWISDVAGSSLIGTGTATPEDCMRNRDTSVFFLFATDYRNSLSCIITPSSGSGTESFSFTLAYNSAGGRNLQVNAVLLETFIPLASDLIGNVWQAGGLQLFAVGEAQPVPLAISVTS